MKNWYKQTDTFGITHYNPLALIMSAGFLIAFIVVTFAGMVYRFEYLAEGANVTTYRDALWLMVMSMSTIGFGDHYPVTDAGRFVTGIMFMVGMVGVGFIATQFASLAFGWTDKSIKNAELRNQNQEIIDMLKESIPRIVEEVDENQHIMEENYIALRNMIMMDDAELAARLDDFIEDLDHILLEAGHFINYDNELVKKGIKRNFFDIRED